MPLTATGEASGSGQEAGAGARGQPEPQLYWAFHGKSGAREFSIGSLEQLWWASGYRGVLQLPSAWPWDGLDMGNIGLACEDYIERGDLGDRLRISWFAYERHAPGQPSWPVSKNWLILGWGVEVNLSSAPRFLRCYKIQKRKKKNMIDTFCIAVSGLARRL